MHHVTEFHQNQNISSHEKNEICIQIMLTIHIVCKVLSKRLSYFANELLVFCIKLNS